MYDFQNELQMMNLGDFNASEVVALDPHASYSNSVAQLPIIGIGACARCFSCFNCFNCANCFNCFRCSNCFRCGHRCGGHRCGGRCHG